ncbi:Glucose 1-dehydrogenase 1 [Nocardia farcinica]|uniref:SDR family NAD(P)-dependent oxidoreductase n=1 Tax=Nocardia farcinica TaxID=37329 RepID=UPI000C01B25F|nr:SDR family NAD(P)-dependent oxidoreductase [Nocardia farcinica]PFX03532.1 Glucose 1-dehydrogenase 1 [Nocardia farcinica]PFX08682.1 Glucose 1-dehydrogenase 1 [Nocardia farcinica]
MNPTSTGRVAVVTGAAGSIGSAIAAHLAADGARVVLTDRDGAGAERRAAAIREAGGDAVAAVCDQTDPGEVDRLFVDVVGDQLDICVANAGYGRAGSVLNQDLREWQRHVDVNLTGTFLVCRAAARTMAAHGRGGSIVINASTAAVRPCTLFAAYAASKAGADMFARCLADELGPLGIRVNTICPGVIQTGMTGPILGADGGRAQAVLEAETPLGRVGDPEDVAEAVAFLVGDGARFITGASILIDGGQTLRGYPRWFVNDDPATPDPQWRIISDPPAPGRAFTALGRTTSASSSRTPESSTS